MAQTKRKRRTKHRGNAAGTIETRGRTGRPPPAEDKKKQARMSARERRLNTPPTWKSSINRAALASAIIFVFVVITGKTGNRIAAGLIFALVAMAIYVPAGYYMELMLFRRRQAKRQASGSGRDGDAKR
jgi:cytochrome c-type biogenesis protein CcmH/NrfG